MNKVYVYVVDRDFGFAPNPFHGYCTLATCKPKIRAKAVSGDWIVGMGGTRLKAVGRCVFAMRVTQDLSYDAYWGSSTFFDKRPVRNGSRKMMVGDNIYHFDNDAEKWIQEDSHHSNPDGSPNYRNLDADTKVSRVLVSDSFFYFGRSAPIVPTRFLNDLGYKNGRGYRVFNYGDAFGIIGWLTDTYGHSLSKVLADPFDFSLSERRYSGRASKII